MRFKFCWLNAERLPSVIVIMLTTRRTCGHSTPWRYSQLPSRAGSETVKKKRRRIATPAALEATERKAGNGVGAPWYTSGYHILNGEKKIVYTKPARISVKAMKIGRRFGPL